MELKEVLDPSCLIKSDIPLLDIIGNPTRRRILVLLSCEPHYASQIARILNISQPAVVKQLRILEEADLIQPEKRQPEGEKGPERLYYSIASEFLLIFSLGSFYVRGRSWSTTVDRYKGKNPAINSLSDISEELIDIEKEIVLKEKELVSLETRRNMLFHQVYLHLQLDDELKRSKSYLQRAIIRALLMCEEKLCVDELARSLEKGETEILSHLKNLRNKSLIDIDIEKDVQLA